MAQVWESRWHHWPVIIIGSVILVALGWQLLALQFPPYEFPGLFELWHNVVLVLSGGDQFSPLSHYRATILRVAIGFSLAICIATAWGVAMGIRPTIGPYLAGPLFIALTVPSVVWAFLAIIWFGLTELLVPVFVIVAIVTPYLTVTMWKGIESIDHRTVAMARSFGATPLMRWRWIYLPHLSPYLIGAARVGLAVSWKVALVAEVFGSATGVGVVIKFHFESLDTGMVIAWALPIMILIYGVDRLFVYGGNRSKQWQASDDSPLKVIG